MKYVVLALPLVVASIAAAQDAQEIDRKLRAVRIDTDFKDTLLSEVINFIHESAGINALADPALKDRNITVTLKLKDVSVRTILNLICESNGIAYKYRDQVLYFTTKEKAQEDVVLKIYDVQDMLHPLQNFPGAEIGLNEDGVSVLSPQPEPPGETLESVLEELVKTNTGAKTWDDNPNASIQLKNGLLLVKQTPEVHKQISAFLSKLR